MAIGFAAGFFLATSSMPTLTSPQRPMSSPQSVQVIMLSSVEWAGTVILLLPHLRHLRGVLMSGWIGSVTVAPPFPLENISEGLGAGFKHRRTERLELLTGGEILSTSR